MDHFNVRVLFKEPRGFIRLLQVLFSMLAWSTTAGFSTMSYLQVYCAEGAPYSVEYKIEYPFDLRNTKVLAPDGCELDSHAVAVTFPIDFSAVAMLYVLVCFLSLVYSAAAAVFYSFYTAKYETDPLATTVDLSITIVLTILWTLMTCLWALNVSDLKHYTHPNYFKEHLSVCNSSDDSNCQLGSLGKWSSLTASLICGFTSVVLWAGSTWFIFKESPFHKKPNYQAPAQPTTVISEQ